MPGFNDDSPDYIPPSRKTRIVFAIIGAILVILLVIFGVNGSFP